MNDQASVQYCSELPPDIPPGMTLDEWRHRHERACEARHRHLLRRSLHWRAFGHRRRSR